MASNVKILEGNIYSSDADIICVPVNIHGLSDKRVNILKKKEKDVYRGYVEDISTIGASALFGYHFVCRRANDTDKYISLLYCRKVNEEDKLVTDKAALVRSLDALCETIQSWRPHVPVKTIAIALDATDDGREAITTVREYFFDKPVQVDIYWCAYRT